MSMLSGIFPQLIYQLFKTILSTYFSKRSWYQKIRCLLLKWPKDVGSPIKLNYGPIFENRMYIVNMKNFDLKIMGSNLSFDS